MKKTKVSLAWQILLALVLGILLGSYLHYHAESRDWLISNLLTPAGDIFIHLIKMIVVPIVISTLIVGIAGVGDAKQLGRIGAKTIIYFEVITTVAIVLGITLANVFQPGTGIDMSQLAAVDISKYQSTTAEVQSHAHGLMGTILSLVPTNIVASMAKGDMLPIIFFSVLFWALFEQAGSSLTLFADQSTQMPSWFNAAMTQTFNPGIIVLGGPIIAALWVWLAKRKLEPSTPVKFSFGLVFVGLGFLVLTWAAATQANDAFRVPLIFLFLTYFFHTIGELCLSPVGLSMITKLSVARVVGMMMGVWFLSSSVAHIVAGIIAKATATDTVAGVVTSPELALQTYGSIFGTIGWTGVGVGVFLLLMSPLLKKGMAGIH